MQLRYRKGWSHHQPVLPDTYTSDSRSLHQRFQKSRLNNAIHLLLPIVREFTIDPAKDYQARNPETPA